MRFICLVERLEGTGISFFNSSSGIWQKDSSFSSSGDEIPFMGLDETTDISCSLDHFGSKSESESGGEEFCREELLNNVVWGEVLDNIIDEDTLEARNSPFVDVDEQCDIPSNRTLINCLVIRLAFFWAYFPIPNNAMEFLLLSLKRFFQAASFSNNWLAMCAIAFPGSLYLFQR